jgi:hypothetical protein
MRVIGFCRQALTPEDRATVEDTFPRFRRFAFTGDRFVAPARSRRAGS